MTLKMDLIYRGIALVIAVVFLILPFDIIHAGDWYGFFPSVMLAILLIHIPYFYFGSTRVAARDSWPLVLLAVVSLCYFFLNGPEIGFYYVFTVSFILVWVRPPLKTLHIDNLEGHSPFTVYRTVRSATLDSIVFGFSVLNFILMWYLREPQLFNVID